MGLLFTVGFENEKRVRAEAATKVFTARFIKMIWYKMRRPGCLHKEFMAFLVLFNRKQGPFYHKAQKVGHRGMAEKAALLSQLSFSFSFIMRSVWVSLPSLKMCWSN